MFCRGAYSSYGGSCASVVAVGTESSASEGLVEVVAVVSGTGVTELTLGDDGSIASAGGLATGVEMLCSMIDISRWLARKKEVKPGSEAL